MSNFILNADLLTSADEVAAKITTPSWRCDRGMRTWDRYTRPWRGWTITLTTQKLILAHEPTQVEDPETEVLRMRNEALLALRDCAQDFGGVFFGPPEFQREAATGIPRLELEWLDEHNLGKHAEPNTDRKVFKYPHPLGKELEEYLGIYLWYDRTLPEGVDVPGGQARGATDDTDGTGAAREKADTDAMPARVRMTLDRAKSLEEKMEQHRRELELWQEAQAQVLEADTLRLRMERHQLQMEWKQDPGVR